MQHAERLCDRIVLLAKGRKIFDGTIAAAKRTFPRRVRIETEDSIAPLEQLGEVAAVRLLTVPNGEAHPNGSQQWELELHEQADPQAVLQACFAQRIRLHSFNQSDPTLHEVFVRLVGTQAKEAS